ncbi:Predicted thiol-disulfide oxidoreductase YuxK, DCC family [Paracoccus isoporae]|uniref:Predicted thiol-disulfide oxidoreductase YuxK, DCC family n=1 Tax=Paracoccus isoporae TaxID=591205 RepID=A0A1G6ZN57_9RHOB|nr:DUF393 domain-containing protein [Paracoccus isoporae]SDE03980.1 Predicted thiol-disulfide oxidoreductase YuxK, DCC family [Paracoccus isoporae]
MTGGITIIYDGQCPFCASYVSMMRLREAVGPVELVDARTEDPRVEAAIAEGLDLDQGMVVFWQGRRFFGSDAVQLIATLSAPDGRLNGLQRRLFASPRRAAVIYPLLARARRLYLRLARKAPIAGENKNSRNRE